MLQHNIILHITYNIQCNMSASPSLVCVGENVKIENHDGRAAFLHQAEKL